MGTYHINEHLIWPSERLPCLASGFLASPYFSPRGRECEQLQHTNDRIQNLGPLAFSSGLSPQEGMISTVAEFRCHDCDL